MHEFTVITGCTDGIGKGYALELAKDGLNLVLISRTTSKLEAVASEIESKYGVQTEIVQADFMDGESIYPRIEEHLKSKDIAMLINNVGVMVTPPKYFYENDGAELRGAVNVNVVSVVQMTKLVLPQMMARRKGAVVNIASIAASGPIPLNATYAASKAFVEFFSVGLRWESRGTGVTVQTVCPGFVATNLVRYSKWLNTGNIITPNAERFCASAVATIGYTSYTTGYWSHGIQKWFVDLVPRFFFTLSMDLTHKFLRYSANAEQKS